MSVVTLPLFCSVGGFSSILFRFCITYTFDTLRREHVGTFKNGHSMVWFLLFSIKKEKLQVLEAGKLPVAQIFHKYSQRSNQSCLIWSESEKLQWFLSKEINLPETADVLPYCHY